MERTYCKLFETHEDYQTFINSSTYEEPNISICKGFDSDHVHFKPIERMIVCIFNVTDISQPTQIVGNDDIGQPATSQFESIEIDGVKLPNVVNEYQFSSTGLHTVKYSLAPNGAIADGPLCVDSIVSIKLPYTVKSLGMLGISSTQLSSIDLGYVELLQGACVMNTDPGLSIYIPKTVNYIGMGEGSLVSYKPPITGSISSITVDPENPIYDSRNNCNAIIETATNALLQGSETTVIPNDIVEIKNNTFSGQRITSITIPESVTSIGENSFNGCTLLTSVYCLATVPPTLGTNAFGAASSESSLKIYVPAESLNDYSQATYWSDYYSTNQILAIQS